MMIRDYAITARMIGLAVAALIIVIALSLFVRGCEKRRSLATQNRVAEGQAGAAIDSGAEAMNTVSNVAAADAATDALVAAGQAEVTAAVKGQKGAAAKRAACRLKAYRDTPQCKEPVR